jgi:hypothetical protein
MALAVPMSEAATPQVASSVAKPGGLPAVSDGSLATQKPGASWLRGARATMGRRAGALASPPNARNVKLVSRLALETAEFGPVAPEQVADVAVHKDVAYVMSWARPFDFVEGRCFRGGFWSVDISDPANPVQLNFEKSLDKNYHGEGAHVIEFPDGRDVLAVNNETCVTAPATPPDVGGGFDLWDVSDPADPQPLVRAAGDYAGIGTIVCCTEDAPGATEPIAHQYHSVFMWRDGDSVYLVGVDNNEITRTDVDIFDITDPTAPVAIAEYDLDQEFGLFEAGEDVFGNVFLNGNPVDTNLHDMVVKEIDGVPTMLASYWDGGYVLLDVSDPAAVQYIGDSSFAPVDPLTGLELSTGNAHQAEFSHDNRYILAADEDFAQYRAINTIDPGGPNEFQFGGWGDPTQGPIFSPDTELIGPTIFVGNGCDPATIPAPPTAQHIAVVERGTCAFQIKVESADTAGYDRVVIFNNNAAGNGCETLINMLFDGYTRDAVSVFVSRSVGMRLLGVNMTGYTCTQGGATTPTPAVGTNGLRLSMDAVFDGWGYAHQFETGAGKLTEVGKPYAIPESLDEDYAVGFGDLSIHEWATDPDQNLAYASYYAGGLRVVGFNNRGMTEQGHFIDTGGNNFWGVEQFTTSDGERLIAASDRDFGLYILRYTGPDAPADVPDPQPTPTPTPTPAPSATTLPAAVTPDTAKPGIVSLSSANRSLRKLRGGRVSIRLRLNEAARVQVTLQGRLTRKNGRRGSMQRLARTTLRNVGANQTRTITLRLSSSLRKRLRDERRVPARLSLRITDAAGNVTTRNVSLTFR